MWANLNQMAIPIWEFECFKPRLFVSLVDWFECGVWTKILQNRNGFKNHFQTFANQVQCPCYFVFPKMTKPFQSDHIVLCQVLWLLPTAKIPNRFEFKKSLNSFENHSWNSSWKKKRIKEKKKARRSYSSPAAEPAQLAHPAFLSLARTRRRTHTGTDTRTPPPLRLTRWLVDLNSSPSSSPNRARRPRRRCSDAGNGAA